MRSKVRASTMVAACALVIMGGCGGDGNSSPSRRAGGLTPAEDLVGNVVEGEPSGSWSEVGDAPLSARSFAEVVWTGDEVLVIGGNDNPPCPPNAGCVAGRPSFRDGAAYDPVTEEWRRIADAPVPFEWGHHVAVVDGRLYAAVRDDLDRILRYDPKADEWSTIPAPDAMALRTLVTDGDRLLAPLYTTIGVGPEVVDMAFDPATEAWTKLPADPLRPSETRQLHPVDGRYYLFAGGMNTDNVTAATLEEGAWRKLPEPGSDGYLPSLAAGGLIMTPQDEETAGDGDAKPGYWALDTTTNEWVDVPEIPSSGGPAVSGDWNAGITRLFIGDVVFDTGTRRWSPLGAPEELERKGITAAAYDDHLVAFGGATIPGEQMTDYAEARHHSDLWMWSPD